MSDHPRGRMVGWVLVALAGLALAVVLSVTASSLSTQPIGLSGEPLRAGDRLAPTSATHTTTTTTTTAKKRHKHKKPKPKPAGTTPVPTQTAVTPAPTSTGSSGGDDRHPERHHGGDD